MVGTCRYNCNRHRVAYDKALMYHPQQQFWILLFFCDHKLLDKQHSPWSSAIVLLWAPPIGWSLEPGYSPTCCTLQNHSWTQRSANSRGPVWYSSFNSRCLAIQTFGITFLLLFNRCLNGVAVIFVVCFFKFNFIDCTKLFFIAYLLPFVIIFDISVLHTYS